MSAKQELLAFIAGANLEELLTLVALIEAQREGYFELNIAMRPVKVGAT